MKGRILGIIALAVGVITAFVCCFSAISHVSVCEHHKLKVVIDAGHGGVDGGVVGKESGKKESEVNLVIASFLKAELESASIEVVMTRQTDAGLYGVYSTGFKRRDMQKRREIILKAKPDLVVSVHQNYFQDPSVRGTHVFYKSGDENGNTLAGKILAEFQGKEGTPKDRNQLVGDYYVLNCTAYPSVIVECGFLSCPLDEALLITEDYERTVALRIARGIESFLLGLTSSQKGSIMGVDEVTYDETAFKPN